MGSVSALSNILRSKHPTPAMAISTLVLVASTWLAGTSASYASVNRVNAPLTIGTSPRPGQAELVHLTQGSIHPPEDECLEHTCKDQGSFANNIYECPSLNGNTRVTPNGDPHKIYCGVQNDHATLRRATTDSFIACVDTCSEDEECVGVGWNHTDSVCTMKTEYMTPTLPSVENINIDSASEQCPSLDPEVKRCQAVNGKIHCDFGEQFKLFCNLALLGITTRSTGQTACTSASRFVPGTPGARGSTLAPTRTSALSSPITSRPRLGRLGGATVPSSSGVVGSRSALYVSERPRVGCAWQRGVKTGSRMVTGDIRGRTGMPGASSCVLRRSIKGPWEERRWIRSE